jgi:hypothetical protein
MGSDSRAVLSHRSDGQGVLTRICKLSRSGEDSGAHDKRSDRCKSALARQIAIGMAVALKL